MGNDLEISISVEKLLEYQSEILEDSCAIDKEIRRVWKSNHLCSCVGYLLESQIPNCKHVNKFINRILRDKNEKIKEILFLLSANIKGNLRHQFFHTI